MIQRNVKAWCTIRSWNWYHLFQQVKPLLKGDKAKEELEELRLKAQELEDSLATETSKRASAEKENAVLVATNDELKTSLEKEFKARKGSQHDNDVSVSQTSNGFKHHLPFWLSS